MGLHVERGGSGPAMVLSHGLGSSCRTWDALRVHLEAHWSVTAWDLPGHGQTERTDDPADYHAERAHDHLARLTEASGAPAVLAGHSFGGFLSLELAERRPELVRALVLVATGPGFRNPAAREQWNQSVLGSSEQMGVPPHVLALGEQHDSRVLDDLATIAVPVLVVVGERDRRFHAATELFAAKLGAEVLRVAGAGHHVHDTHAAVVAPVLLDFLGRVAAAPSSAADAPG